MPVSETGTSSTFRMALAGLAAGLIFVLVTRYFDTLVLTVPLLTSAGSVFIARYQVLKHKISELRAAVDTVDNALVDDKVTEGEFRDIWARFYELLTR